MNQNTLRRLLTSGAALAAMGSAGNALAAPTTAGTAIVNTATATYTVGGAPVTTLPATTTFVVDRKVVFTTVSAQPTSTKTAVGALAAVTTFTVTNYTNGVQDIILDPDQAGITGVVLPGVDTFDVSNLRAVVDSKTSGTVGSYDAGDTAVFIDELAPNASATVFILADIGTPTNPDTAYVSLHTIVAAGGGAGVQGAVLFPTDLALIGNRDAIEDIVFADDDSGGFAVSGDIVRNGQGRAFAAYQIGDAAQALRVTKTSRVISDGVNLLNPRALPGATVEYCLTVTNTTLTTTAQAINLTDVLPTTVTYVPGSLAVGPLGVGGVCLSTIGTYPQNDDGTQAAGPYTGAYDTPNRTVRTAVPQLGPTGSLSASFRVVVN